MDYLKFIRACLSAVLSLGPTEGLVVAGLCGPVVFLLLMLRARLKAR